MKTPVLRSFQTEIKKLRTFQGLALAKVGVVCPSQKTAFEAPHKALKVAVIHVERCFRHGWSVPVLSQLLVCCGFVVCARGKRREAQWAKGKQGQHTDQTKVRQRTCHTHTDTRALSLSLSLFSSLLFSFLVCQISPLVLLAKVEGW